MRSDGACAKRRTPASDSGAAAASNLASVAVLVGSGALAAAAGVTLPSLDAVSAGRRSAHG